MGILHEKTNPRTPQENGVAERVNWTLVTMTIAMLKCVEAQLGHSAWPYAIRHAALIKNVSPHSSLPDDVTPYERYTGNKPSISIIRSFSCKVTIHTHRDLRSKLDDHSTLGIHLGVAQGKKAFLVYNPLTHKVNESRDVHFFEQNETESEHVTIKVESLDSPTHVVVPEDNAAGLRNMDEGIDGNGEDPHTSDDDPVPEQSQP